MTGLDLWPWSSQAGCVDYLSIMLWLGATWGHVGICGVHSNLGGVHSHLGSSWPRLSRTMSGSIVLLWLGSVLIFLAHVSARAHMDSRGLGSKEPVLMLVAEGRLCCCQDQANWVTRAVNRSHVCVHGPAVARVCVDGCGS